MAKINSFVENVNAIANASALAVGDIVEDTQAARDEAVAAATNAKDSEIASKDSEELSHAWANKGHNNPVTGSIAGSDAEFSSYHWSVEASNIIGDPIINDAQIRTDKTFSSQKITDELTGKSDTTHTHSGLYEPVIVKNSGFNKPFGGNGLESTVARGDHNHDDRYHTKFTENTAFNRNFGTNNFEVMRGDTRFDNDYMPLETRNSAYNKNFVADSLRPLADEIPRGNHSHEATGIGYDSTSNAIVTSSTAQGAITQIDSVLGQLDIAEATYITLLSNSQYNQPVASSNTPTKLLMPLPFVNGNRNATNNANAEIVISYNVADRPKKLVEGFYVVNIVFSGTDEIGVNMALNDVIIGDAISSVGAGEVSLTQFITNIDVTGQAPLNATSATLSIYLTNLTSNNNIVVESCNMAWRGAPEGAIVSSGINVDHGDLTGTGAPNGVHTISDIPELVADLATRPLKIGSPTENNVLIQSATGDLKDSGVAISSLTNKIDKIATPVNGNLVTQDATGNLISHNQSPADLALVGGNASNKFLVADGTTGKEAVNKGQIDSMALDYTLKTDFNAHKDDITTNPHGITPTMINAAEAVHTHVENDITGLSTSLAGKINTVSTAIENNTAVFDTTGNIKDSGLPVVDPSVFETVANADAKNATQNNSNLPFSGLVTTDASEELDLTFNDDGLVIPINNQYVKIDGQVEDLYGPELVTNGDFNDGTNGWITAGTVVDGQLNALSLSINEQNIGLKPYTTYVFTFAASNVVVDFGFRIRSVSGLYDTIINYKNGQHRLVHTTGATPGNLLFYSTRVDKTYTLDNISAKEISTLDFTNYVPEVYIETGATTSQDVASGDYVVVANDIYRNETSSILPVGSNIVSTMTPRHYISNQVLAGVSKDINGNITIKNHIMFNDFVDGRTEFEHMTLNGFSTNSTVGEYNKGTDTFIPLGYFQTLNKGSYEPVLNPLGSVKKGTEFWYEGTALTNVAECFTNIGPVSGRPDSRVATITYEDQLIPMYTNAREFSDSEIADANRKKYVNGIAKGILAQSVGTSLKVEDQTDTAKTVWALTEKARQVYEVLSTADGGTTWVVESFTFDAVLNQVTISSQTEVKISYEMINPMMQVSGPLPITYTTEKSLNTSSHSIAKGAGITNLLGGIATGNGAITLESDYLRSVEYDELDAIQTVPKNSIPTLTADTSKASKSFYNVVNKDGVLSDNLIVDALPQPYTDDNGEYNDLTSVYVNQLSPFRRK